jgi:cyclopropane fatty-acyl-phospholipid synthase-like methyltransferase
MAKPKANKSKADKPTDNWFKAWFNSRHYLELYSHRDSNDARKIVSLITKNIKLPKGSRVLDLACGNGRHSILFARKGFSVLGIDLSPYLISEARKKLNSDYLSHKNNLKFEINDMRKINHKNEFDLVVNLFSSFGYFDKDSENFKVIKNVSDSLKRGGYFFFDFLNAAHLQKSLIPFDIKKRNHNIIILVREINNGFVKKNIIIIENNPGSDYSLVSDFYEKIKLYSINDFMKIFNKYGLEIVKTFGDYKGSRFNPAKSERLIILAKKK